MHSDLLVPNEANFPTGGPRCWFGAEPAFPPSGQWRAARRERRPNVHHWPAERSENDGFPCVGGLVVSRSLRVAREEKGKPGDAKMRQTKPI